MIHIHGSWTHFQLSLQLKASATSHFEFDMSSYDSFHYIVAWAVLLSCKSSTSSSWKTEINICIICRMFSVRYGKPWSAHSSIGFSVIFSPSFASSNRLSLKFIPKSSVRCLLKALGGVYLETVALNSLHFCIKALESRRHGGSWYSE